MEVLQERLLLYLKNKKPKVSNLTIKDFQRVPRGGSKQTYLFHLEWREHGSKKSGFYALRYEAPDNILGVDIGKEAQVLKCIEGTGIPVPKVYWAEKNPEILGRPFFIVEAITGEVTSFGKLVGGDNISLRERRAEETVSLVARLHTLDWRKQGLEFLGVPADDTAYAEEQLDLWKSLYDKSKLEPNPVVTDAFQWLRRNIPKATGLCLVHCDLKADNIMFEGTAVRSMLDWEMATIGDPLADVAWFCMGVWCVNDLSCGLIEKHAFISNWEKRTGFKVDKDAFLFWEVFSCFKLLTIHNRMCYSFVTGKNKSLERVIPAYVNPKIFRDICELLKY